MLTLLPRRAGRAQRGFTLIELMVTIAVFSLLLWMAAPFFGLWLSNSRVRTVSDTFQTGARLAQAEALRLSRQVVFFLTNDANCNDATTAAANGAFWAIRTVELTGSGIAAKTLQCGQLADFASGVTISAVNGTSSAVCFNALGRQVANPDPGVGGIACALNANGRSEFEINKPGADRRLRVLVHLGGQVRMCDPERTLSDATPDGCPPPP